jgi:hypothetical protein
MISFFSYTPMVVYEHPVSFCRFFPGNTVNGSWTSDEDQTITDFITREWDRAGRSAPSFSQGAPAGNSVNAGRIISTRMCAARFGLQRRRYHDNSTSETLSDIVLRLDALVCNEVVKKKTLYLSGS